MKDIDNQLDNELLLLMPTVEGDMIVHRRRSLDGQRMYAIAVAIGAPPQATRLALEKLARVAAHGSPSESVLQERI